MGRPVMTRSIKRNRLRGLDMATECAGQIAPAALQQIAECGVTAPKSEVAEPRAKKKAKKTTSRAAARPSKRKTA